MTDQPAPPAIPLLPPALPTDVLAAIGRLPARPAAVTLTGGTVELRPIEVASDAAELFAISNGSPVQRLRRSFDAHDAEALVWRFMPVGPFADQGEFAAFLADLEALPDARTFVVVERATGDLLGALSYLANRPADLKVEIGAIWYTPPAQASVVNAESCFLLLDHAFSLGYRRIEWKCNDRNDRSRRAAVRLGFTFEGVHEGHMIVKGANRDTAWYRILAAEWPDRRAALAAAIDRTSPR